MKYQAKKRTKTAVSTPQSGCLLLAIAGMALSAQAIPIPISGAMMTGGTSYCPATEFTTFEKGFLGGPSAMSSDYSGSRGAASIALWSFMPDVNPHWFDVKVLHANSASENGRLHSGRDTAVSVPPLGSSVSGRSSHSFDGRVRHANSASDNGRLHSGRETAVSVPDAGSTLSMLGAGCLGLCMMGRKRIVQRPN